MTALATDKFRKYKSLFSTTLSTGIGTGTSDTITPATVTGLPTDTGITLTIDRVDSSGTATPSKMERITGIISGGNLIDYVRGVDGTTDQAHSAGAVIEMVWNSADLNALIDGFIAEHSQAGVHGSTLVTTLGAVASDITAGSSAVLIATPKALKDAGLSLATTGTLSDNSDVLVPSQKAVKTYVDSGTATFTNKRINPRIVTAASYTTDTGTSLDVSTCDEFDVTAQAGDLKLNNPGGTPVNGQKLIVRIKDDGTARALTYDTQFRALTDLDLPTTTIVNQTLYMEFIFNSADTKWDLIDMSGRINFKVGTFDRDIATASGTQAITGVGFKPKYIEFRGCIAGGAQSFNGVSDGTTARCVYSPNFAATPTPGLFQIDTSNPITILLSSSNYYSGTVAFNDDGFTITWTKTGTPTGIANIVYTAYR